MVYWEVMAKFTHLHAHSHYSLLQALPKIPDLVAAAKKDGMKVLALTDNGNMYGAIEFYKECKDKGIKPILGVDFYVAPRTRADKQAGVDARRTRLVLLAKNVDGYHNLIQLVTASYLEGFYYKPRLDKELIEKFKGGLIAIIPSNGDIALSLQANDMDRAIEVLNWYKKIFGTDVYVEITHHPDIDNHEETMRRAADAARRAGVPLVAGQEVYYLLPEDKIAQRTMMLVSSSGGDVIDRSRLDDDGDYSFISNEQAQEYFRELPEALANNKKIADECNLELTLGKWFFPNFPLPQGVTPDDELKRIVYEGFQKRAVKKTDEAVKRVEYELSVIKMKGYAPYFLIVADLLRFAREKNILSNIRGSVSGSMVTYLAGITNIDPLEFEIPFERFLNPDRPSAPDIDMDFADDRRDEVIEYTRQKYGKDHVAQIGTFGTMAARGSVRDVTRALGFPVEFGDRLAKLIPMGSQGFPMTIDHALELVPELKQLYETDAEVKRVIDLAKKIEGCARHISVHAAGVVVAPSPITDFAPLQYDPKGEGKIITQYDMYSIDENNAGLLKFDFLGLKNLTILYQSIRFAKKIYGTTIELEKIPLDDKRTFNILAKGQTVGLFQLNGDGMTRYLKELRPTSVHDINAMVALYRPGPIQFIPVFIACKHDPSKVKYLDPALEPILKKTYGVLVYQDDLLIIAHDIAGYTWGEVDKFRKAVGKKIPKEMAEQKDKFIQGCVKHSKWPLKKAEELWTWIEPFAAYAFNKAHSVSYGWIAYITAYFKANFPAVYMANVLTSDSGEVEKIAETIAECKRMDIPVLPPSVNESFEDFSVVPNAARTPGAGEKIRFGLKTIKNFGDGIATSIIEDRKQNGPFASLTDFLTRIKDKNLNKKSLEALVKVGALDEFGDRSTLFGNIDLLLQFNKEQTKGNSAQDSLFGKAVGVSELRLPPVSEIPKQEILKWEKELLGLFISGHPLDKYKAVLEKLKENVAKIKDRAAKEKEADGNIKEHIVTIGGVVEDIRAIRTKGNDEMCFMRLADLTGTIEVVVFPRLYAKFKNILISDKPLAVKGKVNERNDTISLLAENFMDLK